MREGDRKHKRLEIRAHAVDWRAGIELMIKQGTAVAVNIELKEMPPDACLPPLLTIKNEVAQTLLDDLWQAGIRPSDGSGNTGTLRATGKHLEDMRLIAFNKLGIVNYKK